MRGETARQVEAGVDSAAAALLAAAIGFALFKLLPPALGPAWVGAGAAVAAALAFLLCRQTLGRVAGEQSRFCVPIFDVSELAAVAELEELLLTEKDRLNPGEAAREDPLVLDDILTEIGAASRVVRLFDPSARPTPGQLKTRIDRHLDGGTPHSPSPDASQALYDALADLRRSLR